MFNKKTPAEILDLFEPDPHIIKIKENFANNIGDIHSLLAYLAEVYQPSSYLEIGVRRGFSMAMVSSFAPTCALIGIDMWIENYGNAPNPGPKFVQAELYKLSHQGLILFLSGDSHIIVPQLETNGFDLILIDGDHTYEGALADMINCFRLMKRHMVIDDLLNPDVMRAWREFQVMHPELTYTERDYAGLAVKGAK